MTMTVVLKWPGVVRVVQLTAPAAVAGVAQLLDNLVAETCNGRTIDGNTAFTPATSCRTSSMQPFKTLTGTAAPLDATNVDTDAIIPKQHLKTIQRTGLGKALFEEWRYELDGSEKPDFVLNKPRHRNASILIAGANFGCGSSREHAPWALLDYGIRCVIAPSFADIFYNNCFNNGILPITLPADEVAALMREAEDAPDPTFTIDLERKVIVRPQGNRELPFDIDDFGRHRLLEGLDQVGLTLVRAPAIDSFENRQRVGEPWLYPGA